MMGKGGCLTNPPIPPGGWRPGMPIPSVRPLMGGLLAGKGMVGPGGAQRPPGRRSWSPHAGSRAIRQCTNVDADGNPIPAAEGAQEEDKQSSRSPSPRSSSSSSEKKKKKKKKNKKSKKKKKKDSSDSDDSSSERSRSRSRSKRYEDPEAMEKDASKGENKEVEEAKMLALQKLQELQKIEPKESRAKEWRKLLRDWHPDKNADKKEVATEVFQFLQKGKNLLNLA